MKRKPSALRNGVLTADLLADGVELMRQNIRRRDPAATDAEVQDRLHAWLQRREDPVPGDVAGPVRVRSTFR